MPNYNISEDKSHLTSRFCKDKLGLNSFANMALESFKAYSSEVH